MKKKYKKVVRKEKKSMQRDIGLIKDDRETEQILRKRERSCSLRRQMWNLRKNKLQKADKKYTEIEKKDEKRQIKRKTDKNSKHREWPDIWKDRRACREKDEDT